MSTQNHTNTTTTINPIETLTHLVNQTNKNTQKIRLTLNYFKSTGSDNYRSQTVKFLQTLGVTSKEGNNISYQYVRNIELQILTTKK